MACRGSEVRGRHHIRSTYSWFKANAMGVDEDPDCFCDIEIKRAYASSVSYDALQWKFKL